MGPINYSLTPQLAIGVPVPLQENGRCFTISYWLLEMILQSGNFILIFFNFKHNELAT